MTRIVFKKNSPFRPGGQEMFREIGRLDGNSEARHLGGHGRACPLNRGFFGIAQITLEGIQLLGLPAQSQEEIRHCESFAR